MKKVFVIICIICCSCANEIHDDRTIEDDIIDLNWNSAVKDFYLLNYSDSISGKQELINQNLNTASVESFGLK